MGWTSVVKLHIRAPAPITRRVRRRFTHKGFQNFSSGYRGLIGMDAPGEHAEVHAKFSALAMEHANEAQLAALSGIAAEVLLAGGVAAELAEQIAVLASESYGELLYEFSIWKDNVLDVADRALQVLARAMADDFGALWRDLQLSDASLFIHVYADLGSGSLSRFDLTPTLRRRCQNWDNIFFDGGGEVDEDEVVDTCGFESFTAELMATHEACEPEAFGCYQGGCGAKVSIEGLQARPELNGLAAKILGPVDLETGRWPVELLDGGRRLSVKRQNLITRS